MAPCSVCEVAPELSKPNSKLTCGHEFCADCCQRYVNGSLIELRHHLRCSICGELTVLSQEVKDVCIHRFGRDLPPALKEPKGIFWTSSGHFVITDAIHQRVFVFDENKNSVVDFAYIHGCEVQNGVVLTNDGHVVVPLSDGKYVNLAYYNIDGELRGTLFLKPNTHITGMTLTTNGDILAADGPNQCVYRIDSTRKIVHTLKVNKRPEEHFVPYPHGVAGGQDGGIIVTDTANNRVRVYDDKDEVFDIFGSSGERPGQFKNPTNVVLCDNGNILITDTCNHRIQMFTSRGRFLQFFLQYNEGEDVFMAPVALAIKRNILAVLLKGKPEVQAGEVRLYKVTT